MTRLQFRVLYREFRWRLFDLELLSADALGDASKLLGRFAALIIMVSLFLAVHALEFGGSQQPPELKLAAARKLEHFLIATTMLVVGLFAVLSWDSTFPDRRDVLILTPLPVRARMLFLAKASAMATALGSAVLLLHAAAGLIWPFVLAEPGRPFRCFLAYWGVMFGAGGFVFCCVLGLQGLAAQLLPRRTFLRLSSLLQLAAFSAILGVYCRSHCCRGLRNCIAASGHGLLGLSPTYWFVGLFQQLNGSPALATWRSGVERGLAVGTAGSIGLCHFRRRDRSSKNLTSCHGPAEACGCRALARTPDGSGAFQHPHSAAQPAASPYSRLLSRYGVRVPAFSAEADAGPVGRRAAARSRHCHDGVLLVGM